MSFKKENRDLSFYSLNILIFSHVTIKLDYNKCTVVKASLQFFITNWGLIVIKKHFQFHFVQISFQTFCEKQLSLHTFIFFLRA